MTHAAPDQPSRSRRAWPETPEPPEPIYAPSVHSHDLPSWLRRTLLAVGAFMLLSSVGLGALTYYVYLDHEYVLGRGQFRDAERVQDRERTTEQIRAAICDLLDGLPAGPVLDPRRAEYRCGPGVPLADLPPEAQQQLDEFASSIPEPSGPPAVVKPVPPTEDAQQPAEPTPETTDAPSPTPPVVPPPVAPVQPTPTPPPIAPAPPVAPQPFVDLEPLTDRVCGLFGICI